MGVAVSDLDGVTQQNVTQTEELSATSQQLATHAAELQRVVSSFTLDHVAFETVSQKSAGVRRYLRAGVVGRASLRL